MSVTITDLITAGAESVDGVSKAKVEAILTAVFGEIEGALTDGDDVIVRNFGRFYLKVRQARTGRNPMTDEPIDIPAKTVVKFTPRGSLKSSL